MAVYQCVVIGAGPGGLATVKELLENNVGAVICLERSAVLGGVFSDPYDGLLLTSSPSFSIFSDYLPRGSFRPHAFWSANYAVEYWTAYASHYGVLDHVRFDSNVVSISRLSTGLWLVSLDDGSEFVAHRVAVATGGNQIPKYPKWRDTLPPSILSLHSTDFRSSDPFVGKNVLIVGGGESASDIALQISRVAKTTTVALRFSTGWVVPRKRGDIAADTATHRGLYWLPRGYGRALSTYLASAEHTRSQRGARQTGAQTQASVKTRLVSEAVLYLNSLIREENRVWGTYGTKSYALPEAMACHGCRVVVGEISSYHRSEFEFQDPSLERLAGIEAVVFCTGYRAVTPFPVNGVCSEQRPRDLFCHMFDKDYGDSLAWIGFARPAFGSQFPVMEMQARYFALLASGKMALPTASFMREDVYSTQQRNLKQFEKQAVSKPTLVDYHHYMDGVAALIGCKPPLFRYVLTNPLLWLKLVYGPTQASQYRLVGPGAKPEMARHILEVVPTAPVTSPVVQAGLVASLCHCMSRAVCALAMTFLSSFCLSFATRSSLRQG